MSDFTHSVPRGGSDQGTYLVGYPPRICPHSKFVKSILRRSRICPWRRFWPARRTCAACLRPFRCGGRNSIAGRVADSRVEWPVRPDNAATPKGYLCNGLRRRLLGRFCLAGRTPWNFPRPVLNALGCRQRLSEIRRKPRLPTPIWKAVEIREDLRALLLRAPVERSRADHPIRRKGWL